MKKSFASSVLTDFAPEHQVVAVEGKRLNGVTVPARHRHAVLDGDRETIATGPTREAAIESAAREVLRQFSRRADRDAYCLARLRAALKTIQTGGEE